jgi:PST family polysaccharide transporter
LLEPYILVLGPALIAMAWQAVPRGLLIRRHMFKRLALSDLAAIAASYGIAIIWATRDSASAAPLVGQLVSLGILRGIFISASSDWRPGIRMHLRALSEQFRFLRGSWLYSTNTFASRNVDNLMVGRLMGVSSLGLYTRAFSLFLSPFTQLQYSLAGITLRYFSRDQMPSDEKARQRYLNLFSAVACLATIVGVALLAGAEPVVGLLFGNRWLACVPLVRAFSFALWTQLLLCPGLWFLQARGPEQYLSRLGYLNLLPLLGVLVGALAHSLVLLAIAYSVVCVVGTLAIGLVSISRATGVTLIAHVRELRTAGSIGVVLLPVLLVLATLIPSRVLFLGVAAVAVLLSLGVAARVLRPAFGPSGWQT